MGIGVYLYKSLKGLCLSINDIYHKTDFREYPLESQNSTSVKLIQICEFVAIVFVSALDHNLFVSF